MDVTVVMPVRDRAATLQRALDSISAQTVQPAEVIVVDDASSDGSPDIARAHGATVIVNPTNQGSGPSRNTAIRAASTRWIAFLDSDDQWYPEHLETLLAASAGHVLVTSAADDTQGRPRGNVGDTDLLLTPARCFYPDNPVVTSTTLVDRATVVEAGLFRPIQRAQDLDLWPRVLERGSGVALRARTAAYFDRGPSESGAADARDRAFLRQVLDGYADSPWMTDAVRYGVLSRTRWDDLRLAMATGERGTALRHAAWLGLHPRALGPLWQTLQLRRAARRQQSAEPLVPSA